MSKLIEKPFGDRIVRRMAIACFLGLGGFIAWGGFVPLEEGVAATGLVVVESDRQVIQHLEGGIIKEIAVKDGDWANAGDVLVVLEETVSRASRDQVIQEYAALAATVERLQSLQDGKSRPDFSFLNGLDIGDVERADITSREQNQFDQQKSSSSADIAVLVARRDAARKIQASREDQIKIAERSLVTANEELKVVESARERQLATVNQVTQAQRLVANLEGEIARLTSELGEARSNELDLEAQIRQTRARTGQDLSTELNQAKTELQSVEERLSAAQDVLNRSVIVAPVSGEVLNLQFATIGGVVQPGQTLMEIVPDLGEVTASVQILPNDRASVREGQVVRTQITAYQGFNAPTLEGKVVDVSADLKTDPVTSAVYYEARIRVPASELRKAGDAEIIPGMPVSTFIYSGQSRTMLDYLFAPIIESMFRGLRS